MAFGADIKAGGAYVEISADDSKMKRGLLRAQARLRSFARVAGEVGAAMTAASAAALLPMALSANTFLKFSDQMLEAKAVTSATSEEFKRMTDQARLLGRTTSFTAQQVSEGMTELGRAGFKSKDIEDAIPSVLNLARATRTDLGEAATIAAATMRGFKLEAKDTLRISDILTATANRSATNLTDLGEAMKYVAPQASAAGESLEDTAAALGVLANNGIKGSMAGNQLARAYKNLSKEAAQSSLAEIGVSAVTANGDLRKMADILSDVGNATKEMGSAKRLSIFESLFGLGQAGALKLSQGADFRDMRKTLGELEGAALKTAKVMDSGLGGAFRIMMSAAEGVQLAIGGALSDTLTGYMRSLTATAGDITTFINANKDLLITIGKVALGVGAVGVSLLALASIVKIVAVAITALNAVISISTALSHAAAANPFFAVLVGSVAALAGVSYAMSRLSKHTAKTSSDMSTAREQMDGLRRVSQLAVERLGQLAKKTSLNSAEQTEASKIIKRLESRYGALGVSIDKSTGKLVGLTGAQKKLNEEMQRRAKSDINAEISELKGNITERTREAQSGLESFWSAMGQRLGVSDPNKTAANMQGRNASDLSRIADLQKRLSRISNGDAGSLTGDGQKEPKSAANKSGGLSADTTALAQIEAAEKSLAAVQDRVTKERQTELENEIDGIKELGDEYDDALKKVIAGENAKPLVDLQRVKELEAELAKVGDVAGGMIAKAIKAAADKAKAEIQSVDDQIKNMLQGITGTRASSKADKNANKLIEADPATAVKTFSDALKDAAAVEDTLKGELTRVKNRAFGDGKLDDGEKRELSDAQERVRDAAENTDQISAWLENAKGTQDAMQEAAKRVDIRGSFSASALGRQGFGDSAGDRQAKASEKTATFVKELLDYIKNNELVFAG